MKIGKFVGINQIGKIFREVRNFFRKQGEMWNRGKCIIASEGMDAPGWKNGLDIH